jgi:diaminopimelate decarboxylase
MNHFEYRNDELYCEDVPLDKIAREVGTPVYVYSTATLTGHYQVFDRALADVDHLICFAVKANSNLAVLKLLFKLGAGADIVSGGELFRVLRAGGNPKKVVFSGVGKTEKEMREGLEAGILAFNVESEGELEVLNAVAGSMGKKAPVSLRVNPDVDAETHPYISTGLKKNKFGIPATVAIAAYRKAKSLPNIEVTGIDCHIGSQLTKTQPFADAMDRIGALCEEVRKETGVEFKHVDIGGGLGIRYAPEDPEPPSPEEYCEAIVTALKPLIARGVKVICEPGRVIVGHAGVLLTRALYNKATEIKQFLVVDAAFNDLLRPAFYGSYHPMQPVRKLNHRPDRIVDVVGPICETGDFLARDRALPLLEAGDLLCIGAAGAYGFVMASNYNSRPRAAEVLVSGDRYDVVRRRETYEELIAHEVPR